MTFQTVGEGGRGEQIIPHPFLTDQLQLQMTYDDIFHSCNFSHLKLFCPLSATTRDKTPLHIPPPLGTWHRRAEKLCFSLRFLLYKGKITP